MTQPTALLMPTTRGRVRQENDAVWATTLLSPQTPDDLRLAECIEQALHGTGYTPLRGIEIAVQERFVHLDGRVPTYHLKQLAQATTLSVPGVHHVHNGLHVEEACPRESHRPLEAAQAELGGRQPWTRPGVLVVDDEYPVRLLLQTGLTRRGFDVRLADNGSNAIDLYRKSWEKIDVVLLDVCMPGLDGPQTLDALRELNPDLRACFMSGDTGVYQPEELLRRGASRVIAKPFFLDDLANILRDLARGVFPSLLPSDGVSQGARLKLAQ